MPDGGSEPGIALDWAQPFGSGSGRWQAFTPYAGLWVEVTAADNAVTGGSCGCEPGECEKPGMPSVTMHATAQVPMLTVAAGSYCWLASLSHSWHVPDATGKPDGPVNLLARALVIDAAGDGRKALAELAAHAARLGETPLDRPAVKLLDEALFLRMNGERPPGSPDATWHRWDDQAERYLRGLLPAETINEGEPS